MKKNILWNSLCVVCMIVYATAMLLFGVTLSGNLPKKIARTYAMQNVVAKQTVSAVKNIYPNLTEEQTGKITEAVNSSASVQDITDLYVDAIIETIQTQQETYDLQKCLPQERVANKLGSLWDEILGQIESIAGVQLNTLQKSLLSSIVGTVTPQLEAKITESVNGQLTKLPEAQLHLLRFYMKTANPAMQMPYLLIACFFFVAGILFARPKKFVLLPAGIFHVLQGIVWLNMQSTITHQLPDKLSIETIPEVVHVFSQWRICGMVFLVSGILFLLGFIVAFVVRTRQK